MTHNASLCFYLRARFVESLPLVDAIQTIQGLRHLVLLSYSRSTHLGFGGLVAGYLFDPDITDIGEGAILGAGTFVVAHSLTVYPDGRRLLVTSPIRLAARAVIGGDSQVHAGVRIGSDAVIEPARYVAPFTPTLSAQDTAAWDSLAQLGMAADLKNRYGITLSNQESFRLRSMDHLRDVVRHTIQVSSTPH